VEAIEEAQEVEAASEAGDEDDLCLTVLDWQSRKKCELSHSLLRLAIPY
jgi:hypothetical protein